MTTRPLFSHSLLPAHAPFTARRKPGGKVESMQGRKMHGRGVDTRGLQALALTLATLMGSLVSASAEPAGEAARAIEQPRAVIELFTSQGCSSCPPADKLIGELADRHDVLALTMAVDYWDYLGWKDTLASHGHSKRQKAYARLRGDGKMFTPQAIVNGHGMAIGSDRANLEKIVDTASPPAVPVKVDVRHGRVKVTIGAPTESGKAPAGEIWLCPVASRMTVDIGRGENEGSEVTYHNVVRGWTKLGAWNGSPASFDVELPSKPGLHADAVAVLVQSGSSTEPGPIVGAALAPIR